MKTKIIQIYTNEKLTKAIRTVFLKLTIPTILLLSKVIVRMLQGKYNNHTTNKEYITSYKRTTGLTNKTRENDSLSLDISQSHILFHKHT